jgi:hypothetical protein
MAVAAMTLNLILLQRELRLKLIGDQTPLARSRRRYNLRQ